MLESFSYKINLAVFFDGSGFNYGRFSTCCLFMNILCASTCSAGTQACARLSPTSSCGNRLCHIRMPRCNVTTLMALVDGSPGRRSAQRHESLIQKGPEIGKSWREKRNGGGERLQSEREEDGAEQERGGAIKSGGEEAIGSDWKKEDG